MIDTEQDDLVEIEVCGSIKTGDAYVALCREKETSKFFLSAAGPTGGTTLFASAEEIRKFARGMLKALATLN